MAFTSDDVKQFYTIVRRFVPRKYREYLITETLNGVDVDISDIPFRKEQHRQQVQEELIRFAAL